MLCISWNKDPKQQSTGTRRAVNSENNPQTRFVCVLSRLISNNVSYDFKAWNDFLKQVPNKQTIDWENRRLLTFLAG